MADIKENKNEWMRKPKMYRVVFCPEQLTVEDAYPLAKEWGLPIQHGDSQRTENMDFDRQEIQVLSIPVERGFHADEFDVAINDPMPVKYSNDWASIHEYSFILRPFGMRVGKAPSEVKYMPMDEHRAVMNVAINYPGSYELVAVRNGVEEDIAKINVIGPQTDEE
jgi:hypothetical protein